MKITIETDGGWIVSGEFQSKRSLLTFITVPANEVDKNSLCEILASKLDGLYSIEPERDGGLKITLENEHIAKVTVL